MNDIHIKKQVDILKKECIRIKPLVAIRCITYNHEQYIRDALEGFVRQKTNFPFVAIVHDDASTDSTAEIIKEYAKKFPSIIFPIIETENQYHKPNNPIGKIMKEAITEAGAKYIAMCEGDDYWTDPYKLQKQVDFLNANSDYSMCFHAVNVLVESVLKINNNFNCITDREFKAKEIFEKWTIPTCSVVYRKQCIDYKAEHPDFIVGDNVLFAACISQGKIFGFHDIMGVYRRNANSWTNHFLSTRESRYQTLIGWVKHYSALKECYPNINGNIFDNQILINLSILTVIDFFKDRTHLWTYFFHYLKIYKIKYIIAIINRFILMVISKLKRND